MADVRAAGILGAGLVARGGDLVDLRVLIVLFGEPLVGGQHGSACIGSHCDVHDHLDDGEFVRVVHQFAFQVALVKVYVGLMPGLIHLLFLVTSEDIAEFLFQHGSDNFIMCMDRREGDFQS
jgi:hypothetical protein